MSTALEQEVKQILLEELGTLSFAEKRRVRDSLDAKFIDAELQKIAQNKKYPIIMGLFQGGLVVQALYMSVWEQAALPKFFLFISVLAGLFGAVMVGIEFGKLDKRRAIYRIFSRLAESNRSH